MSPPTPISKSTRSRSQSTVNFTLKDVRELIEASKRDIIDNFNSTINSEINKLSNVISSLTVRVSTLEESNIVLRNKCAQLEQQIQQPNVPSQESLTDFSDEVEQRQRRRLNIIFSGIPESKEASVEEKKKADICECMKIRQEIGVEKPNLSNPTRLGRSKDSDHKRLLKVSCSDINQKFDILRKAKRLKKHPGLNRIFINPDRTRLQQKEFKQLLSELRLRRENGEDVFLFGNKIVTRHEKSNFQEGF